MSVIRLDEATPKVSVLMPVYNAEQYLAEAVDSILTQTFDDFELLALDDGSSDNSLAILNKYAAKDCRIRVLARKHRGLAHARIELAGEARGRYFAIMDADDVSVPERLELQVEFLDSSHDYVVVGGWIETINRISQPIGIIKTPLNHEEIDQSHLRGHCSIWHSSAMIRGETFTHAGGYDFESAPAEDLDMCLRLAEVGKIANIPHVLAKYRLHHGGISERERDLQQKCARTVCEKAWARRGLTGRFEATEHWRPGKDKESRHKFALKFGWISWNHNHRETWWTYSREAILLRPFSLSSWQLLVFGFLKNPRKQNELKK